MTSESENASMAEREAELAALQSAFDEYITSSRELEEELDSELAKMQDKLADSLATNAALSAQIENMGPQMHSLEKALSDSKAKLQKEIDLRRKVELLADDCEGRNRELESSLTQAKHECDDLHEELAFKESELEETKIELEVERERHRVELYEVRSASASIETAVNSNSDTGPPPDQPKGANETEDSEKDLKSMEDELEDELANDNYDAGKETAEYVKSLEDELELVTESLIETEKHLRDTQEKLIAAEEAISSNKDDRYATEKDDDTEVLINKDEVIENLRVENNMLQGELADRKEEIELMKEELSLTQEELKAAEVDSQRAKLQVDTAQSTLKQQFCALQEKLETSEINANASLKEVEILESTLHASNVENISLKKEVSNLQVALDNTKKDNALLMDELDEVNSRFDEARKEAEKDGYDSASAHVKEEMAMSHKTEIQKFEEKVKSLTEANSVLQQKVDELETAAAQVRDSDAVGQQNKVKSELVTKLENQLSRLKTELAEKSSEIESFKSGLEARVSEAESHVHVLEKELARTKGKLAEAEANLLVTKRDHGRALMAAPQSPRIAKMPMNRQKDYDNIRKEPHDYKDEDDSGPSSEFGISHALSRPLERSDGSKRRNPRTRSLSPTTRQRREYDIVVEDKKEKNLEIECEKLKKQNRMALTHTKRLEEDLKSLQVQVFGNSADDIITPTQLSRLSSLSKRTSEDLDSRGNLLNGADDALALENQEPTPEKFKMLHKKYKLQCDYNNTLLSKILSLQGNIQVCCRVRPMKVKEIEQGQKNVIEVFTETEIGCLDQRTNNWKSFVFDKVWSPDQDQQSVFSDVEPLALSVVDGYNACIFAYGQTGSGKTYTMEGTATGNQYGISYRTIQKVLNLLNLRAQQQRAALSLLNTKADSNPEIETSNGEDTPDTVPTFNFSLEVGMLEIYNDEVYDLLALTNLPKGASVAEKRKEAVKAGGKATLDIRQNPNGQIEVPGLTNEKVTNIDDVMALLKRGNSNRATASTDLNEHSSRSHMVLSVDVRSGVAGQPENNGTLFLVDLAGSERVRKSNVAGDQLKEAGHINKSLSALGNVMEALDRKASHIPYRDSKLTYLLQNSLGGNSRTMMVLAVCPMDTAIDESLHALNFATRVRRIQIGAAQRNATSKNLEEKVKSLTAEMKKITKSKEKSEMQLRTLKRDNVRIQERLHHISESRKATQIENKTLEVLRKNNADMAARWQKEKTSKEKISIELESCQDEFKRVQSQLIKADREKKSIEAKLSEKEAALTRLSKELKEAKDASSALSIRARKAEIMNSRAATESRRIAATRSNGTKHHSSAETKAATRVRQTPPQDDVDIEKIREEVLALLQKYDETKVGRIDIIMEKFKGKEKLLLEKMTNRYKDGGNSTNSQSAQASLKTRSELALERHKERMKAKKAMADKR